MVLKGFSTHKKKSHALKENGSCLGCTQQFCDTLERTYELIHFQWHNVLMSDIWYFKIVPFFGRKCVELLLEIFISLLTLNTFVFMVTKEPSFHTVVPELYTFPCSILLSIKKLFTHTYIEYMMCDMTESFHGYLSGSTCLNPLGPFPLLGV